MRTKSQVAAVAAATFFASVIAGPTTSAEPISFQEGVSPTPGYESGGVTIRSNVPDGNQEGLSQIIVGQNATFGLLRGLFEFDLSAIEADAAGRPFTIDSASLVLYVVGSGGGGAAVTQYDLHLLGTNSDFTETTVTWNNAPTTPGGTPGTLLSSVSFDPDDAANLNRDQTFGDTAAFSAAVDAALDGTDNTIRLLAKANNESTTLSNFARFAQDDGGTAANHPELIVNYTVVPEPGSLGLMAGALGLLARRRRRTA